MTPELPAEVWIIIISFLRQTPPRPTGNNERSSIRQPFLPSLMRVCKLFNRCTANHLYSTIITDNLPSLIHNLGQPAAATGVDSKTQLLGHVKRLFIEYGQKEHEGYESLIRYDSKFVLVGADQSEIDALCKADSDGIAAAGNALVRGRVLSLCTFATGAFLAGQHPIWKSALTRKPADSAVTWSAGEAQVALCGIVWAASPPQFCHRIMQGPLVMTLLWFPGPILPRQHSVHFQLDMDDRIRGPILEGTAIGPSHLRPSRWYFPPMSVENERKEAPILWNTMREQFVRHIQDREESFPGQQVRVKHPLSVELYIPSAIFVPDIMALIKQTRDKDLRDLIEKHNIPKSRFANDQWVYKKIEEAPECEACGWCADDLW